jgi:hypothetical protein
MSCVVTGAPFNMLAELPMTTASSLATRSALARAMSVFSERSEDVPAVLALVDEHGAPFRRQEQAANDEAQIPRIDLRELWRESHAHIANPARETLGIPRPPPTSAIAPGGATFHRATAPPTFAAHRPCIHGSIITQAFGFFRPGQPGRRWAPFNRTRVP